MPHKKVIGSLLLLATFLWFCNQMVNNLHRSRSLETVAESTDPLGHVGLANYQPDRDSFRIEWDSEVIYYKDYAYDFTEFIKILPEIVKEEIPFLN